eukprot:SM000023S07550  [mRNA]  locus=s23:40997:42403:- [translate_table: standard]
MTAAAALAGSAPACGRRAPSLRPAASGTVADTRTTRLSRRCLGLRGISTSDERALRRSADGPAQHCAGSRSAAQPSKGASRCRSEMHADGRGGIEGGGSSRRLSTEEHWAWHRPHLRHWHGLWVLWEPAAGASISKSYRSVRSLQATDAGATAARQKNQWYGAEGDADWKWDFGPWHYSAAEHSLPDGLVHPQSPDHRVLALGPDGDNCWAQLRVKPGDPKSAVFVEFFFMAGPDARFSVPVGYNEKEALLVGLTLEDALPDDQQQPASWTGDRWTHEKADLAPARPEPRGRFVGLERTITPNLDHSEAMGEWKGFHGGRDSNSVVLHHLPNNVSMAAPLTLPIGKDFKFVATWLASSDEILQTWVKYAASGELEYVRGGRYKRVEDGTL